MGKSRRGVSRELRFAFCSQLHPFPHPHQPDCYGREAVLSACAPDPSLLSGCCPQSSFRMPASPTVPTPSHQHLTHSALSFKKSLPHPYIPLQLRPLPPSLLSPTYQVVSVSLPPTHSSTHSNLLVGPLLVTTLTGPPLVLPRAVLHHGASVPHL